MEITKKAKFITDFYGGKGYLAGDEIVRRWLEDQSDKLLHPRFKDLKNAMGNEKNLEEILSVFNVDKRSYPIIGNWMLLQCSMKSQKLAGTWNKYKVAADQWKNSVSFQPVHISLYNGKLIKFPEGVETYTVTTKLSGGKTVSFFKAYQVVKTGAKFEFIINFPEDLCIKADGKGKDKIFVADLDKTVECVNDILDKMQIVGLGAFRERFGKFKYTDN